MVGDSSCITASPYWHGYIIIYYNIYTWLRYSPLQNNIVQQQYVQTDTGPSHSRVPTTIRTANSDRKSEPIAPAVDADRMHVQFLGRRFPPRHFRFRSPSTLWCDARKTRHLLFLPRKPIRRRHGTIEVWHVYKNLRFIILRATLYLMHTHGCLSCKFKKFSCPPSECFS